MFTPSTFHFAGAGTARLKCRTEFIVGLESPEWKYFNNGNYRYKFALAIKGAADPTIAATVNFGGNFPPSLTARSSKTLELTAGIFTDLTLSVITPRLQIEKLEVRGRPLARAGQTVTRSWIALPVYAPTNGQFVEGVNWEVSTVGKLTLSAAMEYIIDDEDSWVNSGEHEKSFTGSISGSLGAKIKIEIQGYLEYETEWFWPFLNEAGTVIINSGTEREGITPSMDREIDKRPVRATGEENPTWNG
jgi:hypothetical protein